jgi:hypothetical protein
MVRNYFDSLLGNSEGDSDLPLEEEVDVAYIHREVDMDSTRLERQRETGVTPEPEPCSIEGRSIPGWTAMPGGLGEPSTPPVPAGSDVSDTDTEDSAEVWSSLGHIERSPSTIPPADDCNFEEATLRLLLDSRREKRLNQQLLVRVRASRRQMRERLNHLWPGCLDE